MTRRSRPVVLHVDDDPAVRRAVARTLGAAGFTVTAEATGPEGLAAAGRATPDLIILDVDLPGLSGFDVCVRLRADRSTRRVPILHLSGARVDVRDRVQGLEGGADAYLVQPVSPEELVAVARALVARGARGARAGHARGGSGGRHAAAAREDAIRLAEHLLRGPLSGIAINASGLAASSEDPVALARARAIVEAHSAASRVLSDLLERAYLESHRALLPLEARTPSQLVGGAARRLERMADGARVRLAVDAPGDPPVRCDAARLEHALALLIGRALRRAARGGTVRITACPEGAEVRFSVEGDGPPGGEDERTQLTAGVWSTRLGRHGAQMAELALVRAIVDAHHGRVWLDRDRAATHLAIPASPLPAP